MTNISFDSCLQAPKAILKTKGKWTRFQAVSLFAGDKKIKIFWDEIKDGDIRWGSFQIPVEGGEKIKIEMDKLGFENALLLPAPPRFLKLDSEKRIQNWTTLHWEIQLSEKTVTLFLMAPEAGIIEIIGIQSHDMERFKQEWNEKSCIEEKPWAVEGCWSVLRGASQFWNFWILGSVYNGKPGNFGRFPSAQTAWSLYKIASVLFEQTKKNFYRELMQEIAYCVLSDLKEDGSWKNGQWLAEMETHARFQIDGIHLLLDAFLEFKDPVFLEGAEQAASWMMNLRDELSGGGWWFLHDALELEEAKLHQWAAHFLRHRVFGKKISNTLALNTHVSALIAFYRLEKATEKQNYSKACEHGTQALKQVLFSKSGSWIHGIAEALLRFSFQNQKALLPVRALRYFVRKFIIHRLVWIQQFWPNFVTPNGYLWRDLVLPVWGYWYHLVNLFDLIQLYRQTGDAWLLPLIEKGMTFMRSSNLTGYLLDHHHYILPQWLQILHFYSQIKPEADRDWIQKEIKRVQDAGYADPPEMHVTR